MSYKDKKDLVKLLSFMSTFDGGLYIRHKNASFILNMRKENLDYVLWVQSVISSITSSIIEDRPDYSTDGYERSEQVRLYSRTHPFLTTLHSRIYINKHKVIDPHMLKLLDAEALAIIFMTDGSASQKHGIRFHTKGFSYSDNMAISQSIFKKLGLRTNINRHNKYFELRLKSADIGKFVELVKPYICPSFRYKLERIAPHPTVGDEIVWPEWEHSEVIRNV
jgi:hypothetical protein